MPNVLFDHQYEAVQKMKNGCILCGGVGSGKSRTALAYYYLQNGGDLNSLRGEPFKSLKAPRDLYIITTAKKRDTGEWFEDMIPFNFGKSFHVVVDSWNNIKKYSSVLGAFFIFDEQRVVGSGAWVKAFYSITKKNQWVLLSATPGDRWCDYIPVFVANGFYRNKTEFNCKHVIYSRFSKYPKIERYVDTGILIRHRNDILVDMPFERHVTYNNIEVHTEYDKILYKTVIKDRWNIFENQPIKNASELCYTLRKIVNTDESRQVEVLKIFEEHERVIIFYNYTYELEILKALAYPKGTRLAEWNGQCHQEIPETKRWVYLVQYAAGNEGWNCIKTDTIIFFSLNYSYRVMQQAKGRIDRMNTPYETLNYYTLKSFAPIDISITRALTAKRKFNEESFARLCD